ncbi:hydroxymethylglutaryl-CoA lyase [Pullulanibacillus sp. KACC 23026]|uniref:hydroxymethylglutaryl-CoA lyase n=1 Tax=Pullulanibacillus sp. KACC 23026 TaxID=3028315 RepID=UPI0023AF5B8A|nr:hydroxymethylglutaryl-CoA lyase [Pullulanibacillus sp. KACC 23026]WEG14986.1 hydroxymethylglutaryl-CoA lyase [Pullulanibacillus sp. KACC 23026]
MDLSLPEKVTLIEVGPRDGLQNETNLIPTDVKITFIRALMKAHIQEMELTSFVSPKWVPQMSDAEAILEACLDSSMIRQFVLAPNQKGLERFYASHAREVAVFVGVSNSFNKKNINKSTDESLNELKPLIKELKDNGKFVRACISTAFYCPYEGKIQPEAVYQLCETFAGYEVDELSVADTIGMANPKDVYEVFSELKTRLSDSVLITGHFHNTRGTALANIYASLEAGITRFDSSAGGLGGCPFAPGASGNVATEDVLFMLEEMGIETGIDRQRLLEAVDLVKPSITRPLDSKQYQLYRKESSSR